MKTQIRNVNALISGAADYLHSNLGYSPGSISRHMAGWTRIREFMALTGIKFYSQGVEKEILCHYFKDRRMQELSRHEKEFHNSVRMLTEFELTGKIKVTPRIDRKVFLFEGPIGELIVNFIDYKKVEDRLSTTRILCYRRYLFRFFKY